MSTSPSIDVTEICLDPRLRIRVGETLDEMRAKFWTFVEQNPELVVEQDASGEIVIMPPAGAEGSAKNNEIARQLANWAIQAGGWTFDSSAMFVLPNGAKRSPDAAWITTDRWESLPHDDRKKFPEIAPDFVIERRSESDRLAALKAKMEEYVSNGVRLAWLIDPQSKQVHIYAPNEAPRILTNSPSISGDSVLVGFSLELDRIF